MSRTRDLRGHLLHTVTFLVSFFFRENKLIFSRESSARQMIHMKLQTLFSSKDKSKKIKVSSAAIFVWHFKGYYKYY